MRFPKLSELDKDQSAIYNGAPPEGTVLIVGPPGTGKSVIAFHRAHILQQLARNPRVIMYNKVLRRYTSNRGNVASSVEVSTLHSWVGGWWSGIQKQRFARLPTIDREGYALDWAAMQVEAVRKASSQDGASNVNWGHLVIDEGQDFPPAMYACLQLTMNVANASGAKPKLAVTVMADENQRLTPSKNSTINEIRQNLGLHASERNVFSLKKNYRNSRQIAEFAKCFYVGLATGTPNTPTRAGDLPVITMVEADTHKKFLTACAEKIARYAKLRRTEEIAVLVMREAIRSQMLNRLMARLDGEKVPIQSYSSSDDEFKDANALNFDKPGHVTVLNAASAKGLEFDAVFIIDPGSLMSAGSADINARMTLYVLCSRARSFLNVMLLADDNAVKLLQWVPDTLYEKEDL